MCSHCKRVHGAESPWQPVEEWLYRQHGARFSHGICAECAEELYQGLLEDKSSGSG